ncbi:MAG: hypothetical protein ACTSQE_01315 [Candidatus Heimdallarchaeaceae archaeon]
MNTATDVPAEFVQAYEVSFPNEICKAGAQIFPYLIFSELSKNQKV